MHSLLIIDRSIQLMVNNRKSEVPSSLIEPFQLINIDITKIIT